MRDSVLHFVFKVTWLTPFSNSFARIHLYMGVEHFYTWTPGTIRLGLFLRLFCTWAPSYSVLRTCRLWFKWMKLCGIQML